MARYLVTGGAGFIGSHVVDALLGRDEQACPACPACPERRFAHGRRERRFAHGRRERERSVRSRRVRVLDDFSTGKRENLAPWLDRVELIEGDIVRLRLRRERSAERLTNVRDAATVQRRW